MSTTPGTAHTDYDVIVVGARAAGAPTAMLLARAGLRVLVLERAAAGTDTLSTHALMRGAVVQLARWGLLPDIVAAGTPAVRTTVYTYAGARRVIAIKPAHGVDALYAPRRTVLDPILVAAAREAGAEVRHGSTVAGLLRDGERVTGVVARDERGSRELRARLVVGADGIRSLVAREAGAQVRRLARFHTAVSYGYWREVPTEGYEWTFQPDACTGAIPTNDGVCVFAAGRPEQIGRGGLATIRRVVAFADPELAERLERGEAPSGTRGWTGTPGFLRQAHGPGWALVGDAGYFRDPIVAHGLTDALRDAELLARGVIDGLGSSSSDALADALTDYEATRDRLSLPLFETTDRLASHEWDDVEIDGLVRRISSATAAEVDLLAGLDRPVLEVVR